MENKTSYSLGKKDKLKSRKAIEQLFADGKSFSVFPFRVLYREMPIVNCQLANHDSSLTTHNSQFTVAFSVSKKQFKKATDRNRIKRLMREAWRLQKNILTKKIVNKSFAIFIIYTSNELPDYNFVFEKIAAILITLIKKNS